MEKMILVRAPADSTKERHFTTEKILKRTDEYRTIYRQRVVAEHRIARLIRLGVRKARYFGSTKVLLQLAMAAAVASLTLFAGSLLSGPVPLTCCLFC